ncbi:hypothetical protein [Actinoplanes sp. DH11]|uniref:hypothetical protein n=1 Tax=Actinoplanes sp. DH11 TaxID=2857011 RepID=UPI001E3862EB|nr:hypothetical protein [Actinoplanes sp. DH11]
MTTVEEMLAAAEADAYSYAWDSLLEEVRHVGIHDDERALLIERLPAITARFAPADRDNVLLLAGHLAADVDEAAWPRHAEALTALRSLAGDWLASPADAGLFIHRLQAAVALEGDELWGAELHRIDENEIELECPHCGTTLALVLGPPLRPAAPADLDGAGRRLHEASLEAGQPSVATALTYLFGRTTCTECDHRFRVSDQVFRY